MRLAYGRDHRAGGDIGRELAIRLSRRAGHLALVDHDPDRLGATVRACGDAADARQLMAR